MFLRDHKWMKTWSQFVPDPVIFVSLGFILGVLSDQIVHGHTAAQIQIPQDALLSILVSDFFPPGHYILIVDVGDPCYPQLLLQPLQPKVPSKIWQDLLLQVELMSPLPSSSWLSPSTKYGNWLVPPQRSQLRHHHGSHCPHCEVKCPNILTKFRHNFDSILTTFSLHFDNNFTAFQQLGLTFE